jgi:hypothetical protein
MMSALRERVSLLVAVVAGLLVAAAAHGAGTSARVSVMVDHARISTELGQTFVFRSTITNAGPTAASGLIAHLNVLSLHNGVYVDPEDWSSQRTRYLSPIPADGSTTITWRMEAVNSGSFAVYVAVLPQGGAPRRPTTGPAIRVAIAERRTLNSGGILPLALGIPASLAFVWVAFWLRRSRPWRS